MEIDTAENNEIVLTDFDRALGNLADAKKTIYSLLRKVKELDNKENVTSYDMAKFILNSIGELNTSQNSLNAADYFIREAEKKYLPR